MKGHYKRVNVATEHSDRVTNKNITAVRSYSFIKPSSNKVAVGIRNLTSKQVVLKAGTIISKIEAANAVPPMLAPKLKNELEEKMNSNSKLIETGKEKATTSNLNSTASLPEKCKLTKRRLSC